MFFIFTNYGFSATFSVCRYPSDASTSEGKWLSIGVMDITKQAFY